MNAPVTAEATEAQKIEAALDRLVTAAVANLYEPLVDPDQDVMLSAADLMRTFAVSSDWSQAQREADRLLQRPISTALRLAIRTLGQRLNELGGFELMSDVCDRVSQADPRNEGRRAGIIDHRWDGIGHWVS